MSGTTVIDASRNITATGLKATSGFGNKTQINMTSLNANTWYPVTIGQSSAYREKHIIEVGLNSGSTPSWSTHPGGFSLQLEWTTIGSGWGTTPVVRDVIHYTEAWTTGPVAGQIGQLGNSSVEYVYLRGGANYYYRSERSAVPVVRTTTYTTNGQSVSPITTYGNTPWDSSTNTGNPRFSKVTTSDGLTIIDGGYNRLNVTDTAVVINEDSRDMDFRVESNSNINAINVDGSTGRVGISRFGTFLGGSSASATLNVNGPVARIGASFTNFNELWINVDGGIHEGHSNSNPSNRPNSEAWFHCKAMTMTFNWVQVYVTQLCTTITGRIYTRYNTDVTRGGSWTSWVEK